MAAGTEPVKTRHLKRAESVRFGQIACKDILNGKIHADRIKAVYGLIIA